MPRDVQYDVRDKLRRAGVQGSATLYLSRSDAKRLVDGLQAINAKISAPEHIDLYEGPSDNQGKVRFRLDESLPAGVGAIEQNGRRTHISLVDVIPRV